jgi:hypothetical protein
VKRYNEPLRDYIERLNQAAFEVRTDDQMKLYLLDRTLHPGRILLKQSKSKRSGPWMFSSRKHKKIYSKRKNNYSINLKIIIYIYI